MSTEDTKAVIRQYFDQFLNQADPAAAERLLAPDFVCHVPGANDLDREGYTHSIRSGRAAMPDLSYTPQEIIAEGDRVAVRYTMSGTQTGSWQGVPPSGKKVNVLAICTYRVAGGQIREKWLLADSLGLLRQIGALPQSQAATAAQATPA